MGFSLGSVLKGAGSFLSSSGGAAVLSGAASLAGNLLNRHANKENNKLQVALQREQNQFNSDMWDKQSAFNAEQSQLQRDFTSQEREAQQAWQEKMVAEQNDYNSPAAQLQRMKQAGVNPNLFGGQMQSVSASPTGSPTGVGGAEAQASLASSGQVAHTNANVFDTSQLQNIIADTALKSAQAKELNSRSELNFSNIRGVEAQTDWTKEDIKRIKATCSNLNQTLLNLGKEYEKLDKEIANIEANTHYTRQMKQKLVKEMQYFDKDKYYEYLMKDASLRESSANIRLMNSEVAVNFAKKEDLEKHVQLLGEQINSFIIDNDRNSLQFEIEKEGHDIQLELVKAEGELQLQIKNEEKYTHWIDYAFDKAERVLNAVLAVRSFGLAKMKSGRDGRVKARTHVDHHGNESYDYYQY